MLASILSEKEQPPLARYSREAPAELERIVSKALRKTRDQRYQTIKDMLLDLQALKQRLEFESHRERSTPPESKGREASRIKIKKFTVIMAVLVLSAILGIGSYLRKPRNEGGSDSIAILPFAMVEERDPGTEYLSGGVTESIINSLTPLKNLNVIGFSTVSRFKGPDTDPMAVGRALGVRTVLTGQIIQRGDMLTINTRLEDVEGKPIWGKQYNNHKSELLSIQREIVQEITVKLKLNLSNAERSRVTKVYTKNPEANQLYMLGLFHWRIRVGDSLLKSIEYFTEATNKDPNFALAYSGLAAAYNLLPNYSIQSPKLSFPKAIAAARKALTLDNTLPEAHTSLARALFSYDWNVPESDKEYLAAIELDSKYPTAHHWYSRGNLSLTKRFDQANAEMRLAQALDPLSLTVSADLAFPYLYARQPDQAIDRLQKTLELGAKLKQDTYYVHIYLGMAYELKGSYQEAIAEYQKAKEGSFGDPYVLGLLGHALAASGKPEEALGMLNKLKSAKGYVAPYYLAIVYSALNDKDQAFQSLEKSYNERDVQMTGLNVDPLLDNIRADTRFTDLIRKVGM